MRQMDELHHFVAPGELAAGTEDATLARWWDAASADTFRRVDGDRLAMHRAG